MSDDRLGVVKILDTIGHVDSNLEEERRSRKEGGREGGREESRMVITLRR